MRKVKAPLCVIGISKVDLFLFLYILCTSFNTASSATPQIPLCWSMLRSDSGLLRLWHWHSDAVTTLLDLIHGNWYFKGNKLTKTNSPAGLSHMTYCQSQRVWSPDL
jgi:hypothetical protein